MAIYQWNKYSAVKTSVYVESVSSEITSFSGTSANISVASSYTFNPQDGTFTATEIRIGAIKYDKSKYPYYLANSKIYLVDSVSFPLLKWIVNGYELISTLSEVYDKGDLIGVVKSGSTTDYPTNGLHSDGYWYEYIGEIRTIGNMKINGTLYDLTGEGYVKINGVLCPLTSSLMKHNGTFKDMFVGG